MPLASSYLQECSIHCFIATGSFSVSQKQCYLPGIPFLLPCMLGVIFLSTGQQIPRNATLHVPGSFPHVLAHEPRSPASESLVGWVKTPCWSSQTIYLFLWRFRTTEGTRSLCSQGALEKVKRLGPSLQHLFLPRKLGFDIVNNLEIQSQNFQNSPDSWALFPGCPT